MKHIFGKRKQEIIVTKAQSKTLRRMTSATSYNDQRDSDGVLTSGSVQIATNGFMALAIKSDAPFPEEIQGLNVIETEGRICAYEKVESALLFPDFRKFIPTQDPVFEIMVDPRLLTTLLRAAEETQSVRLRFYGEREQFEIIGDHDDEHDSSNIYAVLMPMVSNHHNDALPKWLDDIAPQAKEEK
jgi:hypothetical protein